MIAHCRTRPVRRSLRTPGVFFLGLLTVLGLGVAAYRFAFGLGAVTNLDQQHPWGLWIAIDVATVALAAAASPRRRYGPYSPESFRDHPPGVDGHAGCVRRAGPDG